MEIIVANKAGFCFGVNNAVDIVFGLVEKADEQIYTYGPIIHNGQVVDYLNSHGVKVINTPDEICNRGKVVIRAHGVTPNVYSELLKKDVEIVDATCLYVAKIHKLVREKYDKGYQIIIVGDKNHPEVIGINGWCDNTAYILDTNNDVDLLPNIEKPICIVAQTTLIQEKWEKITEYLKKRFKNVIKFDTICNATSRRQSEADEISKKVNMMLVIGGKNSSNTQKLYEICKGNCPNTFMVETSGDLPPVDINTIKKIGITAGASTPDWVIKEVINRMSEFDMQENEISFKEAFESSLVTLTTGEIVKGKIIGFNNSEVFIDMGYKSDGIIPMDEFTEDPDFDPNKSLKAGDLIDVFIIRVNDGEGNVLLSKKKVDSLKNWDNIEKAYEDKTSVKAKVTEVVNGGVIANAGGVRIFVPASQISDRFIKDMKEFVKTTVNVRIVEINKQRRKVVGSQRVILEEQKASAAGEIWGSIEVGKVYTGTVKSLMDFGAFVDIGGVDGLVHLSELSWSKIKHPSEVVKVGDTVEVTVIGFDMEKKKISLAYRKTRDNPWNLAAEKYKTGDVVKGKVVRLVPFGAFVELEKGIDGLVHISQISNVRLTKPADVLEVGMEIEAKIIEFNTESKKISLSIKEVNPIDPPSKKDESVKDESAPNEEIPTEHKEEMSNKIGDALNDEKTENE